MNVSGYLDQSVEYEEWHFPDISDDFPQQEVFVVETDQHRDTYIADEIAHDTDVSLDASVEQEDEATILTKELALKEALLDEKINYLNEMGLKLAEQFNEVEVSLLQNTVNLIQKTAHKLILREIAHDPQVFADMIHDALDRMDAKEHPCVIYVSKQDMKHTENNIFLSHVQFKINELLNSGDFVIENKFLSLEAILEHRINTLFNVVPEE
jgi:flagellar biosynthesis/type III secretory pathway protein FliH